MALHALKAFLTGVQAAFGVSQDNRGSQANDARGGTHLLPRQARPSTARLATRAAARVLGRAVGCVAAAILIWAAIVVAMSLKQGTPLKSALGFDGYLHLPGSSSYDDPADLIAWDDDVSPREWTSIVLHHSATEGGSAASFDTYHRQQKGWQSLGYDFVIGNGSGMPDGAVEAGPRWRRQEVGAHANSNEYNRHGIGICLVGNFENAPPTPAQLEAAQQLVVVLARRFGIRPERILGHGDIREGGGTICPGRLFPMVDFRQAVALDLNRP